MAPPPLGTLILASASAVLQLFSVAGVGVLAAKYPTGSPLLPPSALKSLSQVSATYLIPCLIVHTVGSAASVKVFRASGLLILGGAVAMAVGPLFMALWGRFAVPPPQRDASIWKVASVASAFPNIVAMPLVIVKVRTMLLYKIVCFPGGDSKSPPLLPSESSHDPSSSFHDLPRPSSPSSVTDTHAVLPRLTASNVTRHSVARTT